MIEGIPAMAFIWGAPGNDRIEAGIRPVCDRINESAWAITTESCEGHGGRRNPFVRVVVKLAHVGHLLRLVRLAFPPLDGASTVIFPGTVLLEGDWYDVIIAADTDPYGDSSLEARREKFQKLAELINQQPPQDGPAPISEAQIKHMVDRFLGWRLPETFSPDAGISVNREVAQRYQPTGTNLFGASEAEAMIRYMFESLPGPASK